MRNNFVPGKGPKNCFIAFVGEAPGVREDRLRQPFVGPTGKLFTELLTEVGIIRTQCYITNVIKHRPMKNDPTSIINLNRKHPVESEEWREYLDFLVHEFEGVKANVIVAVGNIALYALTGKTGITKYRGSILESTLLPGRKVIPLIHPSAAFKEFMFRRYITIDLKRIAEESKFPDIRYIGREMRIEPSFEEATQYLSEILQECRIVAYDIEVINQELSCIAFAKTPRDIMCIPFNAKGANYFGFKNEAVVMELIAEILSNPDIVKVAQNAIFDSSFLFRKYGIMTENQRDTMIAHAILYPDLPKGLDFMTSVYTTEPYYKDEGKMWKGMGGSDEQFWLYNAKDAAVTLEIWEQLAEDLKALGMMEIYEHQARLIQPLTYMSERGLRCNVEGLKEASEKTEQIISDLQTELNGIAEEHGMPELNPRSPKQLVEYFYGREFRNIKPYISRKTGRPTTDEKALKRLSRRGYREAELLLDIRKNAKLKGTYFDVPMSGDGRLRCSFNPVGTESGRLSSSRTIFGEGTNLQNQPKEMKPFFLADDGYMLYNIDLSQAENRIVAYIAPEPRLIQAFETGEDIHSLTASMIFDIPYDEIRQMNKEGVYCDIGRGTETHRFWGKKSNHSFNYGEGYKAFAFITEIPEKEAKFIYEKWHAAYPNVRRGFWTQIEDQLHRDRTITNLYGRKRWYMGRWGHDLFKQAYSFIPQSTVADKINRDGICFIYFNQDLFKDVELLNQVHDSVVFQIPKSIGFVSHIQILRKIVKSLEKPLWWRNTEFVIPAEVEMGTNLKDMIEVDVFNDDSIQEKFGEIWDEN